MIQANFLTMLPSQIHKERIWVTAFNLRKVIILLTSPTKGLFFSILATFLSLLQVEQVALTTQRKETNGKDSCGGGSISDISSEDRSQLISPKIS